MDLSDKPLAVAIGYRDSILNSVGYGVFSDDQIFEDILYNNKHFDPSEMCNSRFKSISVTRLLPVFKYVSASSTPLDPTSLLHKYIENHNSIDSIISKNIRKTLRNTPVCENFDDILKNIDIVQGINKKAGIVLKNIQNISTNEIRTLCKMIFKLDTSENRAELMKSTNFKRCVMILDFLENQKEDQ